VTLILFDYIVGSVHDICGRWLDYSANDTAALAADLGGPEELRLAYFGQVTDMVERLKPDIIAHLDLVRKYDPPGFVFSDRVVRSIDRTLDAIQANGSALDVNCAAFRNGYGPVYPLPQILERARKTGIPVTLGDDSHGVQTVGVGLDQSLAAIAAAGYRSVAYLTRTEGWREAPLESIGPRTC
jgi:histidinol-phosphatase (PHP family)